jgi:hypothetical protein
MPDVSIAIGPKSQPVLQLPVSMEPACISVNSGAQAIVNKCELRRVKSGACEINIHKAIRRAFQKNASETSIQEEFTCAA